MAGYENSLPGSCAKSTTTTTSAVAAVPSERPVLDDLTELRQFAEFARRAIEPGLRRSTQGAPVAEGACLHAAVLLAGTLNKFKLTQARIRGGDGTLQEGIQASDGTWQGHYWVEAIHLGGVFVMDITADQFGHPPVWVLAGEAAASLYRAGRQDMVDDAVRMLAIDLGCLDWMNFGD